MLGSNKKAAHAIHMVIDDEFHFKGRRTPVSKLQAYGPGEEVEQFGCTHENHLVPCTILI